MTQRLMGELELNSVPRPATPFLGSGIARMPIWEIVVTEAGFGGLRRIALIAIARGTRASGLS